MYVSIFVDYLDNIISNDSCCDIEDPLSSVNKLRAGVLEASSLLSAGPLPAIALRQGTWWNVIRTFQGTFAGQVLAVLVYQRARTLIKSP